MRKQTLKEQGQTILILLLVMAVALAIGLSVVQRSLTDISTASQVEESARAFTAAEAGIEKALQLESSTTVDFTRENQSKAEVEVSPPLPEPRQALEYPPLAREEIAHVWLANPNTASVSQGYTQKKLEIFWGRSEITNTAEAPAIELTIVFKPAAAPFQSKKYFFDPDGSRSASNGFESVSGRCGGGKTASTSLGGNRTFYCQKELDFSDLGNSMLVLLRARMFYSTNLEPFAVKPSVVGCGNEDDDEDNDSCSLPRQGKLYTSIGTAGGTQRKIQVLKEEKVVLPLFDYAIFSAGDITK